MTVEIGQLFTFIINNNNYLFGDIKKTNQKQSLSLNFLKMNGVTDTKEHDTKKISEENNTAKIGFFSENKYITEKVESKALVNPQLILASGDIDLYGIDFINKVELSNNSDNENKVKTIVSPDAGSNWYSYYSNEWNTINIADLDQVRDYGMTTDKINNLNKDDWKNLMGNTSTLRFGYYLEQNSYDNPPQVSNLELNIDMKGEFFSLSQEEDFDYHYNENQNLEITLLRDGHYLINY